MKAAVAGNRGLVWMDSFMLLMPKVGFPKLSFSGSSACIRSYSVGSYLQSKSAVLLFALRFPVLVVYQTDDSAMGLCFCAWVFCALYTWIRDWGDEALVVLMGKTLIIVGQVVWSSTLPSRLQKCVYNTRLKRQRWGSTPQWPHSFTSCCNMACVSFSGKSVKQRSLFLHNLPPSMDENFLKILFPRSLKVGLVKVSDDIRWVCGHLWKTTLAIFCSRTTPATRLREQTLCFAWGKTFVWDKAIVICQTLAKTGGLH